MGLREREKDGVGQPVVPAKERREERERCPQQFYSQCWGKIERERHTKGAKIQKFSILSLSLPKSRGVGPDARALENTNASSLARRYKTSARTVESPKLWPSLRGRALCDSNRERGKKNTSEFLNASSGEKRENSQ